MVTPCGAWDRPQPRKGSEGSIKSPARKRAEISELQNRWSLSLFCWPCWLDVNQHCFPHTRKGEWDSSLVPVYWYVIWGSKIVLYEKCERRCCQARRQCCQARATSAGENGKLFQAEFSSAKSAAYPLQKMKNLSQASLYHNAFMPLASSFKLQLELYF